MNKRFQIIFMPKAKFWNTDKILAISAILVSVGTFTIYLYQTHLIRTQQYAAAWPNLELGPSIHLGKKEGSYWIFLENSGVGPAIIEEVHIQYKGKKYDGSFYRFFQGEFDKKDTLNFSVSDLYKGRVFQSGKSVDLLSTTELKTAKKFFSLFHKTEGKDTPILYIRYRSIYSEEWIIDGGFNVAKKVED